VKSHAGGTKNESGRTRRIPLVRRASLALRDTLRDVAVDGGMSIGGSRMGACWWGAQAFALRSNPTFSSAGGSEDVAHVPRWSPTRYVCSTLPYAAIYPPIGAHNL
jgi:hypothetical protein